MLLALVEGYDLADSDGQRHVLVEIHDLALNRGWQLQRRINAVNVNDTFIELDIIGAKGLFKVCGECG